MLNSQKCVIMMLIEHSLNLLLSHFSFISPSPSEAHSYRHIYQAIIKRHHKGGGEELHWMNMATTTESDPSTSSLLHFYLYTILTDLFFQATPWLGTCILWVAQLNLKKHIIYHPLRGVLETAEADLLL